MAVKPETALFHGNLNLEQATAKLWDDHAEKIVKAEKDLAVLRMSLDAEVESLRQNAECLAALVGAGLDFKPFPGPSIYLRVGVADLPRIRAAIGRISLYFKTVADKWDCPDKTGEHVRVLLKCERYPNVFITYVKPLAPDARCKIVNETKTERKLVCSI